MELKYDPNQGFQLEAVQRTVNLFAGEPGPVEPEVFPAAVIGNSFHLDDATLLANLNSVQREGGLPLDENLIWIDGTDLEGHFANFSVEMETGTGKTYVYIRTVLELARRYGWRKYIVVVPSVAVREGVLATLAATKAHFREIFENAPYRYYPYESGNLSQVRQFVLSDSVEIMVMTLDSFNKASNVIHQPADRLAGDTPIDLVRCTRPILILDEPQNMESETSVRALSALRPAFALRYSATHRNPYNLIYRLTPYDAYRKGIVKRIEVAPVLKKGEHPGVFLRLLAIESKKSVVTARLLVHRRLKNGTVRETPVSVRNSENLEDRTNRSDYAHLVVEEINPASKILRFTNGAELGVGDERGGDRVSIFRAQIRYTIEEHFRKQARLRAAGIKVLSLFFVDKVANYDPADSLFKRLFAESFDELKVRYPEWSGTRPEDVQIAYFAHGRSDSIAVDSTGKSRQDEKAFDLIMRSKEELLGFRDPHAFIFSHSALREGWDNPNVFQICTLHQTVSNIKKRQEVGRGVRLCVNQGGDRIRDERLNVLTVVANESYEDYVRTLQAETAAEYGAENVGPAPVNARERREIHLRRDILESSAFRELWKRIGQKTEYTLKVDSDRLVAQAASDLDKLSPPVGHIVASKAVVTVGEADEFRATEVAPQRETDRLKSPPTSVRVLDLLSEQLLRTTPPIRLTRRTLFRVIERLKDRDKWLESPWALAMTASSVIRIRLTEQLESGVTYRKLPGHYRVEQFESEFEAWASSVVAASHSPYDWIPWDSEVERDFVKDLEARSDLVVFLKLPRWFVVTTPIGDYNPDWAVVLSAIDEHGQDTPGPHLYLVRETKGTTDLSKLRPDERMKVLCGVAHFRDALGVDFKVVTSARDLP